MSTSINVVLLIRSLNRGGAERQIVSLARGMQERGHQVRVATFYAGGPLLDELITAGVPVRTLEKRSRWDVPAFLLRLLQMLRAERPDVIYACMATSTIIVALLKPFLPCSRIVWSIM